MKPSLKRRDIFQVFDRIGNLLSESAEKESELSKELERRGIRFENQRVALNNSNTEELEKKLDFTENEFQKKETAEKDRYSSRERLINEAFEKTLKNYSDKIGTQEGRAKYELQKAIMTWETRYKQEFTSTITTRDENEARLLELGEACDDLERRFNKDSKPFRWFIGKPREGKDLNEISDGENAATMLAACEDRNLLLDTLLNEIESFFLPRFFRFVRLSILESLILIIHALIIVYLFLEQGRQEYFVGAAISCMFFSFMPIVVYLAALERIKPIVKKISALLKVARDSLNLTSRIVVEEAENYLAGIEEVRDREIDTIQANWDPVAKDASTKLEAKRGELESRKNKLLSLNENRNQRNLKTIASNREDSLSSIRESMKSELDKGCFENQTEFDDYQNTHRSEWEALIGRWDAETGDLYEQIDLLNSCAESSFPEWKDSSWAEWLPSTKLVEAIRIGNVKRDALKLSERIPKDSRLALPGNELLELPLTLSFPEDASILLETRKQGRDSAIRFINNAMLRLLSSLPLGKVSFTIIDPVGLGQGFAGFMHLADYEEALVDSRIWTETRQIEQRLANLNEHMEKVIQMYLRNEYANITEYNRQAGEIAERYHFLVVADFPGNFSETAIRRLLSIANSGAKCGVYTLIHWDRRQSSFQEILADDLPKGSLHLRAMDEKRFCFSNWNYQDFEIELEDPPEPEFQTELLHKIGENTDDLLVVEVPFSSIAPKPEEIWSLETSKELKVPLGRSGATKLQYFQLGRGIQQHALITGKTGSGKSTLLHVLITNLSLWCLPDEVEFYLVDFKKGVEFKTYATNKLPHARVIAIESDRQFGLSVLQSVDQELKRRGDLFRELGVQSLPAYRKLPDLEAIPRTLLVIDEFQELFVEDDKIAQDAALLLDRLVRQGRAFGIHVLLGSQTLAGAYTLPRSTLGQMAVRIALQCNEADALLIFDEHNNAASLLSRPGEAVYNDASGMEEGNSPFQIVWLPDEDRDALLKDVKLRADQNQYESATPAFIFEGNAHANILRNHLLQDSLAQPFPESSPSISRAWIGEPNSIKGPTELVFERQTGNNVLIIGQQNESSLTMFNLVVIALHRQYPKEALSFVVLDAGVSEPDTPNTLKSLAELLPNRVDYFRNQDTAQAINKLSEELELREEDDSRAQSPIFLMIHGLQRFRQLRSEDDFSLSFDEDAPPNPGKQFYTLLCEGPSLGIHCIVWCDTFGNFNRICDRRALSEFDLRVLFQMSGGDSAALTENSVANQLGLYRALLYNEQKGSTETFFPYSPLNSDWVSSSLA